MAAFNSKVQICNLANGSLGLRNSINNIDTPTSDKELIYSLWYDITRQHCLKMLMPNFALARATVSAVTLVPPYSNYYQYAWEYPSYCLKLLGIGAIDCIDDPPTVEGGVIYTNVAPTANYGTVTPSGCDIRFINDVTDVASFTPDFIMAFAAILGKCTALSSTQDPGKKASLLKDATMEFINSTAQNAQENKPIRKSHSRFRRARYSRWGGGNNDKE